jgi:hypothetical protein
MDGGYADKSPKNLESPSRIKGTRRKLDFSVLFISMAWLVGTVGQSNYAAANGFMDDFVEYRRQQGLVASVLNLGVVEDIGCVSREPALLGRVWFTAGRLIQEGTVLETLHAASSETSLRDCRPTSSIMAIGVSSTTPLRALCDSSLGRP